MSESVHAVVAKPQASSSKEHNYNNCETSTVADEDEDDDIDIISKFSHQVPNSMNFLITAAPSSVGSNNFLFTTATPFGSISMPSQLPQQQQQPQNQNLLDNNNLPKPPSTPSRVSYNNISDHLLQEVPSEYFINSSKPDTSQSQPSSATQSLQQQQQSSSACTTQTTTSTINSSNEWTTDSQFVPARDRLRRALRYYFMSPIDKWRIKGRFPWKLLFQIVKIFLVTSQVILFGSNVTQYKAIDSSMSVSLHNLLLLNWDSSHDIKMVPPEAGPYAVYTKTDVYRYIDHAIINYANISALSVGAFGYQLQRGTGNDNLLKTPLMSVITVCFHRYSNATLNPSMSEYYIDTSPSEECLLLDNMYPPGSSNWSSFSFYQYLKNTRPDQTNFDSLISLAVKLPLRAILLNTIELYNTPQCFDLDVLVNFENRPHSGEINIHMVNHKKQIDCFGNLDGRNKEAPSQSLHISVNCIVLLLCFVSMLLCIRSLWRGQELRRRTMRFFALAYRRHLETQSSLHFIDGWILMILLNDCLLISGTMLNLLRQLKIIAPHKLNLRPLEFDNLCSALLGVGNLLVWFGVLRYLAFFSKYNILIVTLKQSLPRVMRFLLCVLVIYCGFCFSGWIILGPYHYKFQTLARTSECLFALMNGDDVFATFAYLQNDTLFVWWFSRLYLYTFVLLFIYVVLSLFIAILMDSYETIKDYYTQRKRRKGDLLFANDQLARFINSIDPSSSSFEHEDSFSNYRLHLLNDEEFEYQDQDNQTNSSDSNTNRHRHQSDGETANQHHCGTCQWVHRLLIPFVCLSSLFRSLGNKLRNNSQSSSNAREEDDEIVRLPIN